MSVLPSFIITMVSGSGSVTNVGVKVFAVFLFKLKNAEIILEQENSLFCKIGNYSLIVILLLLNFKSKCPSLQYVFCL